MTSIRGYRGFVQDISPNGEAIVIPHDKIAAYEVAIEEVEQEYAIEANVKGAFELVKEHGLELVLSSFDEYIPYKGILTELVRFKDQKEGGALINTRIKTFAQVERRRSRQEVQAQFKLSVGKEKQTYAYDPITLAL
jgi:hypothetical protein